MTDFDKALALRITELRRARGLTLDGLAAASGISRATLSRIERSETSPTASVLGQLAHVFAVPMAELFGASEIAAGNHLPRADQAVWIDPGSGFVRRSVSPPAPGFKASVIEGELPAGQSVSYDAPPLSGLEHHLVMLSGVLEMRQGDEIHTLRAGDCLRFRLDQGNSYHAPGRDPARYVLCVVAP
ncbi:XRE family transcriptional regulator [Roseibium hamelinense]|uniref:XRE family transcriptional regulator n=1 Tax=Roseibium hamelinense TaxID=150831 RepID=A0A562TAZ9_9HYPH|nr:XRE family transcriptional regulator [Roseibium hamelinense]MTI45190.1 XRE family transcriptional regulator [Roseibium hamelinense]TWI90448.1 XRE family transcriptional regulator [Roseibium hamelinense]